MEIASIAVQKNVEGMAGSDEKRNIELMFKHFCNCLYLGQWELARAFVKQLHENYHDFSVLEILKDIAFQPFNRSVLSASVTSPCQLSWLCMLECEKLIKSESQVKDQLLLPDREHMEFQLVLSETLPSLTGTHLKELYLYYKWIKSNANVANQVTLSASLLKFLQTMLSQQPDLGHGLISFILDTTKPHLAKNNKSLQLIYISSINSLLDSLSQDSVASVLEDKAERIYDILSFMEPGVNQSQLSIRPMLSKLLEHCQFESSCINKTRVLSVLIGHSNLHLLEEFCKVDYEDETNKAVATYQVYAKLTEEQRWILHLTTLSDINARWKMFLMFTIKTKRHVLEVIIETGLSLIKCGMFEELRQLVGPEELQPLKPLLLLTGWTFCCSIAEARQLLDTLWDRKSACDHPAIQMGCNKLAHQIDLIQWCLEKTKPHVTEDTGGPQFQRASDLFKGLESHSVLYVLQHSTKLSALDQQEVLELLQNVPLLGHKMDTAKKKLKTVRFQEEIKTQSIPETVSLQQRKDIAIYTGYCSLKKVMDAILYCAKCSDRRLTHPIQTRSRHKVSGQAFSESSSECDSMSRSDSISSTDLAENQNIVSGKNSVNIQNLYKEFVYNKLTQTKKDLEKLHPLTFRVEILENIFSLLFLTYEDVHETLLLSEYASDEGEDSKSVRCGSSGPDTPLLSPEQKKNVVLKVPQTIADSSSGKEIILDYDVPFEEVLTSSVQEKFNKNNIDMEKVGEALKSMEGNIYEKKAKKIESSRRSSASENFSSFSTSSSLNLDDFGFIVNDYLVRDILAMLKDCLLDVSAAKFQIHGGKTEGRERFRLSTEGPHTSAPDIDPNTEEALCWLVRSSITMETLPKRISQMERFTSEAQWRFQLLADTHIPRTPGEILSEIVMTSDDSSDDEVEIKSLGASSKHRRSKRSASGRKSHRGSIDVTSFKESLSMKPQPKVVVSRKSGSHMKSPKLISLMLSSPVTLLTIAHKKGQDTQPKQIIKLFKLEERAEAVEIYFSQAYQKAAQSVQSIADKSVPAPASGFNKTGLKAIASVAAAGLATASVSDIVDNILKFPRIPELPKIELNDNVSYTVVQNFQAENLPIMILLDLMCTAAKYWDVCYNLCHEIKSRISHLPLTSADKTESKSLVSDSKLKTNKIRTFLDLFDQIDSLLHLGVGDENFHGMEQMIFAKTFQKSLNYFLTQSLFPLRAENSKGYVNLCNSLAKYISKVEEAIQQTKLKGSAAPDSPSKMMRQRLGSLDSVKSVSSSTRSDLGSKKEKPVIHHYMKQLVNTLGNEVPTGGILALITRRHMNKTGNPNCNYLLSLYEHCKELACLVAESESISKDLETTVSPKNYFEVLEDSPLRILGRMMFANKMQPARLEKVASKLSLNLTHIIVYSCCVKVPSKRLSVLEIVSGPQDINYECSNGKVIYNASEVKGTVIAGNAEEVVRCLLTKLVSLMKKIATVTNALGLFDMTCAELMTKHTDFYDIITQTQALQSADLISLNKDQRMCFFGNLQSLMTIHCFVNHLWKIKCQESEHYDSRKKEPIKKYSEMSVTEQILLQSTFYYRFEQLGIFSLFDLKYHINRWGLLAPSEWGRTLEHRLYPLGDRDPWCPIVPSAHPQLLFAMTQCCVSSPPIQVLEPATLTEQLTSSMKMYLQSSVQVDKNIHKIKVPELVLWYRRDFISVQPTNEMAPDNLGLVMFISSQLSGDKVKEINELLGSVNSKHKDTIKDPTLDIEVIPYCKDFCCVFDFESMLQAQLMHLECSRVLKSDSGDGTATYLEETYKLTPNTLEYIKSDCPLVATLVSLMCSDEIDDTLLDEAFDDHHFTVNSGSYSSRESGKNSNRSRAPSSMSVVDIRSYRYEKLTNDYPALRKHLLNYIVPLAATEDAEILKGDDPILKLVTSDMVEMFKTNLFSPHESVEFRSLLNALMNELFNLRKWKEIIQVIDSIPVNVVRRQSSLCDLYDFVICCQVHTKCSGPDSNEHFNKDKSESIAVLLKRLLNADLQARVILAVHQKLHMEHNIEVFEMSLCQYDLSALMRNAIEQRYRQLKVYYRITECTKNLQLKPVSEFLSELDKESSKLQQSFEKFTDWRIVVDCIRSAPHEILCLLVKSRDFETARTWSLLEDMDDSVKMEIEENHVIFLLNSQPRNTTCAFQVLEKSRAKNSEACFAMCMKFVETLSRQQDVLFIASYVLKQFHDRLDKLEKDHVRLVHIGAQMILCLPETMHEDYSPLVSSPRFILEQLVMNMEMELANKAFLAVKDELLLIMNPDNKFSAEHFNTLVAFYAKKALEFIVIECQDEKERSLSERSSSSSDLIEESSGYRQSPQLRHDMQYLKRKSVDLQGMARIAVGAVQTANSPSQRAVTSAARWTFVMPPEPPPRDQWVPDTAALECMVCKVEKFSMFTRRHHCRRCGRVVCAGCSENVTPIKGINARTCDDCYREIVVKTSESTDKGQLAAEIYSRTTHFSGSSPTVSSLPSRTSNIPSIPQESRHQVLSHVLSHSHTTWRLKTDEEYNSNLRQDFYFEQAPSTSLCISILNLHGNNRECGCLILGLCDDLSKFLKPLAPGIPNPEVDYSLIISMMKYLLFHAKIKFTNCGDNDGMGQCDIYKGLVDLLELLVVGNFGDLPSISELTKVDVVRRLRDKLIEDERLPLAVKVSMKCGLDPVGVWVAWGMMCLQTGDFTGAREKFSKCLKPVKDKNVCAPVSNVIRDIVNCLENMSGIGSMEIQLLLTNSGSLKNLISTSASSFVDESCMDSHQFQECLYYLHSYGTYFSIIEFYRAHGYLMKAVQYVLDHKCVAEVFIEGLLRPCVENGELARLTDQILLIDSTLDRWNPYLTASCKYFVKNKFHHLLYDFQLFMKDFIRAGMTCYTYFYIDGAISYLDLNNRIQYLFTAQQHMQAYLDPTGWGNVHYPFSISQKQGSKSDHGTKSENSSVRFIKTPDEVSRYIKTIALQIEVTKYLHTCLTSPKGQAALTFVPFNKVPTLFSSQQERNELTIMILLVGENIETSFTLATRIIKEYKLGAVGIYTHVAREFAKSRCYDLMRSFLQCIEKSDLQNDDIMDEILGACLLVVADDPNEAKEVENIIKMLKKDVNKVNAYILCGKLKTAYLMAVKAETGNRIDDVKRILRAAKSMGQPAVESICNKWLEQNKSST